MIGIIGNGSWATALVKMLTDNGHHVNWWMRSEDAVQFIEEHHHNESYLSSVYFKPDIIHPTTDLKAVIAASTYIVCCVPSAYIKDVLSPIQPEELKGKYIISAIKGILPEYYQLLQDFLEANYQFPTENYFSITGPCHAEEVAQERLSYLTFSGKDIAHTEKVASFFKTNYINTITNQDLWGTQYAAVLKNIYALGAGIAHGIGYGDNFMSVFITSSFREMDQFLTIHFAKKMEDCQIPKFNSSAYLGDLLVTSYSLHSRNRTFGSYIGKGYTVSATKAEMNMVAEGYFAVRGMKEILKELEIEMPILDKIYEILWMKKHPRLHFKQIEKMLH